MIKHGLNRAKITTINNGVVEETEGRIISWLEGGTKIMVGAQFQHGQKLALRIFGVDSKISSVISSFDSDEPHKSDIEVQGIIESVDPSGDDAGNCCIQVRFFGKVRMLRSARG